MFVKGLSSELEVLFVHMTSIGKNYNEVTDYVTKMKGVRQVWQGKALTKRFKNVENFLWFLFQGSWSVDVFSLPDSISFTSFYGWLFRGHIVVSSSG